MQSWTVKAAALAAVVGASLFAVVPAFGATFVTNPAGSQTVGYATKTSSTIFKMVAGATANPFIIETSAAKSVFAVSPTGNVTIGGGLTAAGASSLSNTTIGTSAKTLVPLTIKGATGQTADLLDLKSSANVTLAKVDKAGNLTAVGLNAATLAISGTKFTVANTGAFNAAAGKFTVASTGALSAAAGKFTASSTGALRAANGNLTVDSAGNLTAAGSITSDLGAIFSDGFGDLTVGGSLTTDNGLIYSSGLGDLTVNGDFQAEGGSVSTDSTGNLEASSLTADGLLTATQISTDGGGITSNGSGDLSLVGSLTDAGAFAVDAIGNIQGGNLTLGTVDQYGNFTDTPSFTVNATSGNTLVGGSLTVLGNVIYPTSPFDLTAAGLTSTSGLTVTGGKVTLSAADGTLSAANGHFTISSHGSISTFDSSNNPGIHIYPNGDLYDHGNADFFNSASVSGGLYTDSLTVSGGSVTLPAGSIADGDLTSNVALYDAASPTFTGDLSAATLSADSEAITGNLSAGSLYVSGLTIGHMANPANDSYDQSTGSSNMAEADLLNGLAVIPANGASQSNALVTPSAADFVDAMGDPAVGDTLQFTIVNADTGTNQIVSAGSGVTLDGSSYVRYATEYTYTCRVTGTGITPTVTCY